jgi:outer membrane protein insertion porin family/translocation and assembly module TamA
VTGGKLSVTHRASARSSWSVSCASERSSTSIGSKLLDDPELFQKLRNDLIAVGLDPDTAKQEGTLSAVGFDWQHSTTDNVLNARRGFSFAVHAEEAGRLLPGTFNYYSVSADARHFLPIGKKVVVANRIQFGNIQASNNEPKQIPFSKKFFLGGATSLRGWGRYEVSPLGTSGLPIGGNTMAALSSELRVPIKGNFGGVLFIDAGNVWATDSGDAFTDTESVSAADLRYSAGLGLRYQTPIGPVRLDLGYQLNPIDGLIINGAEQARPWRLHFSIGQAF